MGLFSTTNYDNLNDLLLGQIQDLYDAEQRLCDGLAEMAEAATTPALRAAFNLHLNETKGHVRRLEQVFGMLGVEPRRETCDAMKGLLKEGKSVVDAQGDDAVRDAGLIAAAQRVEHYEIAGYGTARSFARQLGLEEAANLLQQTLDEEGAADRKLTEIAESSVNAQAV